MSKNENLTGKKFGRLTFIKFAYRKNDKYYYWECKCDCGNRKVIRRDAVIQGKIVSCGCIQKEKSREVQKINSKVDLWEGTKIGQLHKKTPSNNTSGCKGVSYFKSSNKWRATICIKGKTISLGVFINKEDAIKARKEAEEKYFKPIIEEFNEVKKNESI